MSDLENYQFAQCSFDPSSSMHLIEEGDKTLCGRTPRKVTEINPVEGQNWKENPCKECKKKMSR